VALGGRVVPTHGSGSALARREGFLHDWQLAGSIEVVGDIEAGSRKIGEAFKRSLTRSAKQLKA